MNIANTSAALTPMQGHAAPADGAVRATVDRGFDSVDAAVPADAAPTGTLFAQVLTQRLAKGKDEAEDDDAIASALTAAAVTSAPAAAPADMVKASDAPNDAKADASSDAIGHDLAAQLTLVSQWAGVARQTATQDAPSPAGASTDAPGIGGKLASVRGAASESDSIAARALDVATTPDASEGLAIPIKVGGVQAKGEPAAQANGDSARSGEPPLLSVQPTTQHAAPDTNPLNLLAGSAIAHYLAPATIAPAPAFTPALPDALRQAVGTPAWSHEVGNAMVRMAVDGLQSAALRLNPEHLGPLEVQVRVDNGVAHLAFQAAHAETRQAIEASRPALEQLFSEQGLKIGDCAVDDSASRNSGFNADAFAANTSSRQPGASRLAAEDKADAVAPAVTMLIVRALGMVDTFA